MFSKRMSRKTVQLLLLFADTVTSFIAVWLSLLIRNLDVPEFSYYWNHAVSFIPIFIYAIFAMYLAGLYAVTKPVKNRIILLEFGLIAIVGWFIGFVFFYFSLSPQNFPKTILLLFWIVFCILALVTRKILYHVIFIRQQIPVVFLGESKSYSDLVDDLNGNRMYGYKPVFLYKNISDHPELRRIVEKGTNVLYIYRYSEDLLREISDELHYLVTNGNQFMEYSEFYEYIERKIPPEDIGESWFLSNINLYRRDFYFFGKRLCDILFSVVGIVLTVCFWPLICMFIRLESRGDVLFCQEREGVNGKVFKLYKFRTMTVEQNNGSATAKDDKRITKVGKVLRKSRLDELPQLINVFLGDMSLIGPRPERPELAINLEKEVPWYRQRLLVKPGITGWDQVSGEYHSPSKEDTYKKLQNDLYYIKNCSISLDISIAFKTVGTMLRSEGR